ncbi:MAG: calcium-binding protein [Myxococcota bacterium]
MTPDTAMATCPNGEADGTGSACALDVNGVMRCNTQWAGSATTGAIAYAVYDATHTVCADEYCFWGGDVYGNKFCLEEDANDVTGVVITGGDIADDLNFRFNNGFNFYYLQDQGSAFLAEIYGNSGNDNIHGSHDTTKFSESLYGGPGVDYIWGYYGDDTIYGGDGYDLWLEGGDGNDTIYGGAGGDDIYCGAGDDTVYGGADADDLYGGDGLDSLYGEAGDDDIWGEGHADFVAGGPGMDDILGGPDNDTLHGNDHDDIVCDGDGNDTLTGDAGNDLIWGAAGSSDFANGGANASPTGDGCDGYGVSSTTINCEYLISTDPGCLAAP